MHIQSRTIHDELAFCPSSWIKKDVKDDIVLVTGAGSGIGRLLSVKFAKLGCTVVLWDVNKQGNEDTERMIKHDGGKVFSYTCDLSNKDEIYKTAERVKEDVGNVTILINNAGIVTGKPLLDSPDHMIQRTFAVNILAHFWTVKAFLPDMIMMDKGHIVTIASMAGMFGINHLADYCSSKFAAVGFDDALRVELYADGRKNIQTTVVCPYFISTGMFDGINSKIFPILTPEGVADSIVNAVLTNTKMIVLPKYGYLLVIVKTLAPRKFYTHVLGLIGGTRFMNAFHGRGGGAKSD
uniref:Uncharacterized protein n=1 Tax=Strigamia maritima TaxID=126957 RepID=T1JB39_STRMM